MAQKNAHGITIAGQMIRSWSNDVLKNKTAEDLNRSFGISIEAAQSILKSEKFSRGLQ